MDATEARSLYTGRIAPTPTGELHLGHAATFLAAHGRARDRGGTLLLRIDDLDPDRCKPQWTQQAIADLQWLGIEWTPPIIYQKERLHLYREAWRLLLNTGHLYPCTRSRKEVATMTHAPHGEQEGVEESIFPVEWRPPLGIGQEASDPAGCNWRFRVPDDEVVSFDDECSGEFSRTAGRDFGDFLVWRRDNLPSYELAVVVDDLAMGITEVVRGEDLKLSTLRQLLIYRALGKVAPRFYHSPLLLDERGQRLAKRSESLSLRFLREAGWTATHVREHPQVAKVLSLARTKREARPRT